MSQPSRVPDHLPAAPVTGSGERLCDVGRGVTLCYETFGDPGDPPLLLIMGLGMQMLGWHEDFCAELAGRGFHVVRYDNRDSGRSTRMKGRPPTLAQVLRRRFPPGQYTLLDMAGDAAGLLRELDLAPAHVVGASMGGMIAQTLAAHHPECVRSLTSLMSSTGNRWKGQPAGAVYPVVLRAVPREREAYVEHAARVAELIGSPGFPREREEVRERARLAYDRAFNPAGTGRQLAAILASGDRTADGARITAPTLVVHGTADKMVRPSGGQATAQAIPDARLELIEGWGHDLPRAVWPRLIDLVAEHAARVDAAA